MPPKNKKKGKRLEAEAATAQTDADFDDMLTEVMAVDVTISTGGSTQAVAQQQQQQLLLKYLTAGDLGSKHS
jgi:hypothetical protein